MLVKFFSSYRVKILLEVLKMSNISINYINYDWLKYFKYFNGVNTSDYSVTSESWEHSCNLLMTHPVHCSTLYPAMINMIEQSQLCVWPGSINIFSNYILILSSESWQLCILTVAGVDWSEMLKHDEKCKLYEFTEHFTLMTQLYIPAFNILGKCLFWIWSYVSFLWWLFKKNE